MWLILAGSNVTQVTNQFPASLQARLGQVLQGIHFLQRTPKILNRIFGQGLGTVRHGLRCRCRSRSRSRSRSWGWSRGRRRCRSRVSGTGTQQQNSKRYRPNRDKPKPHTLQHMLFPCLNWGEICLAIQHGIRQGNRGRAPQTMREVLVEQESHSEGGNDTNRRSRSAAKDRQALMSSRVRSVKSDSISSPDMPEARYSRTSYTVVRMPRMQGFPPAFTRLDGDYLGVILRHHLHPGMLRTVYHMVRVGPCLSLERPL